MVGEWFRRFQLFDDKEWNAMRASGALTAELRDTLEATKQFSRFSSALAPAKPEPQPATSSAQRPADDHAMAMAAGCIDRTVKFADVALVNLDAMLDSKGNASELSAQLRSALDGLAEQLPRTLTARDMDSAGGLRERIMAMAHGAQLDGSMRMSEIREVVASMRATLQTLLGNLGRT